MSRIARARITAPARAGAATNVGQASLQLAKWLVAALALAGWASSLGFVHRQHRDVDLRTYRAVMLWWSHGHPLYSFYGSPLDHTLGFTYPPFAAAVLLPLSWVSQSWAYLLWNTAIVVCFAVMVWWVLPGEVTHPGRRWLTVLAGVPLFYLTPIRDTFSFGQVNVFLALGVVADYRALRRGSRWSGIGIGMATAVKFTPGIFIVYLLITRRYRAAAVAAGTTLAATVSAAVVTPALSVRFWFQVVWQSSRIGQIGSDSNQSLYGLLTRLLNDDVHSQQHAPAGLWVIGCLLVFAVGMRRAGWAFEVGDDLAGFTVAGLTAGLLSPISWIHHLVWFLPACVILADVTVRRRAWGLGAAGIMAYALLSSSLVVLNHHRAGDSFQQGPFGFLAENVFAVTALMLVAALPARRDATGSRGGTCAPTRHGGQRVRSSGVQGSSCSP